MGVVKNKHSFSGGSDVDAVRHLEGWTLNYKLDAFKASLVQYVVASPLGRCVEKTHRLGR
jgi:hypothetical protein